MLAAFDVGSNTVRLLIGDSDGVRLTPVRHERRITRLAGNYDSAKGLAPESMERTLCALQELCDVARVHGAQRLRAVGTQALRQARNGQDFVDQVLKTCGLPIDIVAGQEEASLAMAGILSALEPIPQCCLAFDLGGGSTEFIFYRHGTVQLTTSFPLGVVRLAEQFATDDMRNQAITEMVDQLEQDLQQAGLVNEVLDNNCSLVGTAGTVTTLAALCLGMVHYDWHRVNNFRLTLPFLQDLASRLQPLTPAQREALPGMEKGRGDLIVPGLRLVLALLKRFSKSSLSVSDFGLLEGVLLHLGRS